MRVRAPCPSKKGARGRIPHTPDLAHAFGFTLRTMEKKLDKRTIERVKDAARIEEVVADFVTLRKKGVRFYGLCPFHEDRNPTNFVAYPKDNIFTCFACGAKGDSIKFIMMHEQLSFPDAVRWLAKKYKIPTDMEDFNYTPPPARPTPPPLETLILPAALVVRCQTRREDTNLVKWIRTGINWDSSQRARIKSVLDEYHIGGTKQGWTVFWQIDEEHKVRTGKMMKYREDGHRDKGTEEEIAQGKKPYIADWVHSVFERKHKTEIFDPEHQEMRQTLFGMHLLEKYPQAEVQIVESEKTAILMAIAYGNHAKQVWMACGGKENISRERLKPIIAAKRQVVLFPDRDAITDWRHRAEGLYYHFLTVNIKPVTDWWKPCDGEKADIADVVLRLTNERRPYKTVGEVLKDMPNTKSLIERLNLKIKPKDE